MFGSRVTFTVGKEKRVRAQPWGRMGPFLAFPRSPALPRTPPDLLSLGPEPQGATSLLGQGMDVTAAPRYCRSQVLELLFLLLLGLQRYQGGSGEGERHQGLGVGSREEPPGCIAC